MRMKRERRMFNTIKIVYVNIEVKDGYESASKGSNGDILIFGTEEKAGNYGRYLMRESFIENYRVDFKPDCGQVIIL